MDAQYKQVKKSATTSSKLKTHLSAIFACSVLYIFLCLIYLPTYVFRWIISKIVPKLWPQYEKIIFSSNAYYIASDDIYSSPKCTILVGPVFPGGASVSIEKLRLDFTTKILQARKANGEILYPEMTQVPVKCCGFHFWKSLSNFKIEDYVRELLPSNKEFNAREIESIQNDLTFRPYEEEKCLWECLLLRNCNLSQQRDSELSSIVFFRMHHSLTDGYSALNIISQLSDSYRCVQYDKPMGNISSTRILKNVYESFILFTVGFYQLVHKMLESGDDNEWHPTNEGGIRLTKDYKLAQMEIPVSIELIKSVRMKHSVSFTSVVIASMAGAIRKLMRKTNYNIPQEMHALYPLPIPDHPEELTNHL